MADDEGGGGSPVSDLLWLLFFLFVLFGAWFAVGGPAKADLGSLFLQSPANIYEASSTAAAATSTSHSWFPIQIAGRSTASGGGSGITQSLSSFKTSPYFQKEAVSFGSIYGAAATDPEKEYIEIAANADNPSALNISGWRIQSLKTGRIAVIGTAIETPLTGTTGKPDAIVLRPGESAVITTGRSPIGVSFRVNECTGYLAKFQSFTPAITSSCPLVVSDLTASGNSVSSNRSCIEAAQKIPRCTTLTKAPSGVSSNCGSYLVYAASYNSCVKIHQVDDDFRDYEWRVFEGNTTELWLSRGDTLVLLDQKGALVSSISY